MAMKISVLFWVVAPLGLIGIYQCFGTIVSPPSGLKLGCWEVDCCIRSEEELG